MKFRSLLGLALLPLAVVTALAQTAEQKEIINASCMLAFGRPAADGELIDPLHANKSLAELIQAHVDDLKNDPELQRVTELRAQEDARGYALHGHKGIATPMGVTYAEYMKQNVEFLSRSPDHYRQAIDKAYQLVIRRPAYPEEHEYWKNHGTLPYVLLVGAIENWAIRNQPGLMVTTGTPSIAVNSRFLRTQRVPLSVANEIRPLIGLPIWTDVARLSNPGNNVVAVGAGGIASVGGVHFMLTGGGPLAK
jgi:hypothetical protein